MKRILILGACYLTILGCTSATGADLPDVADLIIYNARVLTVNSNFTVANAIAIKDGKILAVGRDRKLEDYRGPETRIVDAQDRIVMPGLYDADVSSYVTATSESGGWMKGPQPDFDSITNAQAYIRKQASNAPAGSWIVLDFVSPLRLKEGRLPTKDELDAATTNHPVVWNFGPTAVVNSKALEVSRIDKDTEAPARGEIVKDARHHKPTGLLRNATSLLKMPKPDKPQTAAQERAALKHLYQLYNQQGITSISEMVSSTNAIDLFRDMARSNELTVRINAGRLFTPSADPDESIDRLTAFTNAAAGKLPYGPTGVGNDWVRIGPLQTSIDGNAGYGTAYLRTPYGIGPTFMNDELAYRGLLLQDRYALPLVYIAAAQQGWQVEAHAAGDAALDFVLNAYEQTSFKFDIKDKRFLIESSEFQAAQDWQRCQDLGVGVVLRPTLLYDDGANLEKTLGDKRMTYYMPFKGWFDRSIVAGGGSGHFAGIDSRNTPHAWSPWLGMWITLTRETREGEAISPEEKLTREQAVRLYTFNNAWLHGEDNVKGSLEPGKYADLIMLDTDILKCPLSEIPNTKVLLTLVNGKPVWQSVEPIFPGPQVIQSVTVNAPLQPVNVASPIPASQASSTPAATTAPAPTATAASSQTAVAQPVSSSAPVSSAPAESATKHAAEATTSVNPYSPVPEAPATPTTPAAPTTTSSSAPVAVAPVPVPVPVASTPATASTPAVVSTPTTSSSSPAAPAAPATQTAPASQTASTPAPASTATAPASASAPVPASTPAATSAPASTPTAPTTQPAPANAAPPVAVAPATAPVPAAQPAAATSSDAGFTSIAGAAPAEVGASQPTASAATTFTNQASNTVTNQAPGTISTNAANAYPAASTTFNAATTTTAPTQGANAAEAAQAAPAATGGAQVASATATWDKTGGTTTSSAATNSAAGGQDWSRVNGAK